CCTLTCIVMHCMVHDQFQYIAFKLANAGTFAWRQFDHAQRLKRLERLPHYSTPDAQAVSELSFARQAITNHKPLLGGVTTPWNACCWPVSTVGISSALDSFYIPSHLMTCHNGPIRSIYLIKLSALKILQAMF